MTESEASNWVLVWVEDLHRRAGSKRFWEEEQERIDLGTCLILSCSLWSTFQRLQDRIKQHVPKSIRSIKSIRLLPKGCKTESNNMSPNLSVLALLPKNAYFLLVGANLPPRLIPSLLLLIQPLDFIFYKILPALNIMMTADFLFLPKAAHLSIYLLLKPLSSKLLTPPSADKKNSYTA